MKMWHYKRSGAIGALCLLAALACVTPTYGEDAAAPAIDATRVGLDTVWVL